MGSRADVIHKLLDMLTQDELELMLIMEDYQGKKPLEISSASTRKVCQAVPVFDVVNTMQCIWGRVALI